MNTGLIPSYRPQLDSVALPDGITPEDAIFALCIIQGFTAGDSYRKAYAGRCKERGLTKAQISRAAYKVKTKPLVVQYMRALIKELETAAVATSLDLQMFLSAVIFTPIGDIDETHPLCQKRKSTVVTTKDGGCIEREEFESVPKLEAAKTLIRMKGYDAPLKVDVNHNIGVMVVPMASTVDEWEAMAAKSQQALMDDAIDV